MILFGSNSIIDDIYGKVLDTLLFLLTFSELFEGHQNTYIPSHPKRIKLFQQERKTHFEFFGQEFLRGFLSFERNLFQNQMENDYIVF